MQHYECTKCHTIQSFPEPQQVGCNTCGSPYVEWITYPSYAGEATLELVKYPNQSLKTKCRPLEESEFNSDLGVFCNQMINVMRANHGVGLAANQVGDSRRIVVLKHNNEYLSLVNPEVVVVDDTKLTEKEGCLSFPGLMEVIGRAKSVTVNYKTPLGIAKSLDLEGIESICIQHEVDHLDGLTFIDRMSRLKKQIALKKLSKQWNS